MEQNPIEKIKARVAESIEKAKENPIEEARLVELEEKLSFFKKEFLESGQRNNESTAQEDEIEAEILRSSALADNLPEYREMLQQIAPTYGLGQEWVDDLLAHENAHGNVAAATGHEWVGYAAVFIKEANGNIGVQPLHFTKPDLSWGPKELITKSIEVTRAPETYSNELSDGDNQSLAEDQAHLEEIRIREQKDSEKLMQVRSDLGI